MKDPSFDSTPEFQHFREVMRGVLKIPKTRSDELVREASEHSTRKDNSNAPGRKRKAKRKPRTQSQ
jgi:hypothetical protein